MKCTRHTLSRLVIFCFVENEYGGTQMKRVKKLHSMTARDNLNFETKGLQCITFGSSSYHSERLYLERKWKQCLARGDLQLPIRNVKAYDSSGAVTYTLNGTGYFLIIPGHWMIIKIMNKTEKAINVLTTQRTRMKRLIKNPSALI